MRILEKSLFFLASPSDAMVILFQETGFFQRLLVLEPKSVKLALQNQTNVMWLKLLT